jgi:hypothetical protein
MIAGMVMMPWVVPLAIIAQEKPPDFYGVIEQQRQQCHENAEAAAARAHEQAREQARAREQEARFQEREQARGYQRISVESFVLDGRDLAASEAKVSLSGSAYFGEGNIGVLYADRRAFILANASGGNQPNISLLTDYASREFRQGVLACRANPASVRLGCPVTVLGHATMCKLSNAFGATRDVPCVVVEEGR